MIQKLINKIAATFQQKEQAKYPQSHILQMPRFIQLNNYSCGIVSAFVILHYYGKVNSIDEIDYDKELLKNDGIDTEPLLNILKSNDAKVSINKSARLDDIKSTLIEGKPILISISEGEHWVVVYGFTEDRIFVLDSSIRSNLKCSLTVDDFLEIWDENWIAVVSS